MAAPYGPADVDPQRGTADSDQAKLTIPYLGPEPAPSRTAGRIFMLACMVEAALYLAKVTAYWSQAGMEQDFLDHPTRFTADELTSGSHLLSTLSTITLLGILLALGLDLAWRAQRRPGHTRNTRGEAYVEFPTKWVTPVVLRLRWVGLALGGLLLANAGSIHRSTLLADYPHHRQLQAASSAVWMAFWISLVVWVVIVNRSHTRRMAFSEPYRADPSQVPFFPPVAGGIFESRGTFGSAATATSPRAGATGIGWMLRTSGLIMLCFIGTGALAGGGSEIGLGHAGGYAWFAAGLAMWAFVIWVMVRRYRRGKL
ncbi:MAG: hypothetical protein ACXV8G_11720 [Acidimicrobiales bacterium]